MSKLGHGQPAGSKGNGLGPDDGQAECGNSFSAHSTITSKAIRSGSGVGLTFAAPQKRLEHRRPAARDAMVSAQMSRMPRRDTGPELALRRALHAAGLRFTVHRRDLPGTPDIVLSRAHIAVFVDGCFWHACPKHGVLPKSNREWWRAKLAANGERDRRKDKGLKEAGWLPVHLWEHIPVADAVRLIDGLWRERTGRA